MSAEGEDTRESDGPVDNDGLALCCAVCFDEGKQRTGSLPGQPLALNLDVRRCKVIYNAARGSARARVRVFPHALTHYVCAGDEDGNKPLATRRCVECGPVCEDCATAHARMTKIFQAHTLQSLVSKNEERQSVCSTYELAVSRLMPANQP